MSNVAIDTILFANPLTLIVCFILYEKWVQREKIFSSRRPIALSQNAAL